MIRLIGEDVSISIEESNPIYKTISKFIGESFLVYSSGVSTERDKKLNQEVKQQKLQQISFLRETIFSEFDDIFLNDIPEKTKIKPLCVQILRSHLESILGGETGDVFFEIESDTVYKRNGKYLIRTIPQSSH